MFDDTPDFFTVDDATLLRAINQLESDRRGDAPTPTLGVGVLQDRVIHSPGFEVLKTNDHLRGLLKTFLEKNLAVLRLKADQAHGYWAGLTDRFNMAKTKCLKQEIRLLEADRDEAFKSYEMLRKLSEPHNRLLKRHLA